MINLLKVVPFNWHSNKKELHKDNKLSGGSFFVCSTFWPKHEREIWRRGWKKVWCMNLMRAALKDARKCFPSLKYPTYRVHRTLSLSFSAFNCLSAHKHKHTTSAAIPLYCQSWTVLKMAYMRGNIVSGSWYKKNRTQRTHDRKKCLPV